MNARTGRREATRFAALAVATSVLGVVGVPVVVVGILVLALDGIPWLLLIGFVLLLSAIGAGWAAYKRLRRLKEGLETPRRRNRVFISYRTAEHAGDAERAAHVLREEGLEVFFAKPGEVAVDADRPLSALRVLGLFQMGELDDDLQRALIESEAMVYFVPTTKRLLGLWQSMKDLLDALGSLLLFESGLTRTFWRYGLYLGVYGRNIAPAAAQRLFSLRTWQAWELAVAGQLGLVVVKVILAQEPSPNPDPEVVSCRQDTLESDLRNLVIPRLRQAARTELKVQGPLPILVLLAVGVVILKVVAVVSLVAVAVFLLARAIL